jgi:hypothetical protein
MPTLLGTLRVARYTALDNSIKLFIFALGSINFLLLIVTKVLIRASYNVET